MVIRFEDLDKHLGQRRRRRGDPGVGHRLTTAALCLREFHLAPEPLQQFRRRHPDIRIKLIDVTGNEQSNSHGVASAAGNKWQADIPARTLRCFP
jgi:DNA-binding transcriptional LysR family regulator